MEMEMETSLQQMMAHLLAEMKASQEKMMTEMKASQEKMITEMKASQEKMITEMKAAYTNLEALPEATEAAVERQKLREEEINAENIGSSEDRSGYQRLAVRRRRGAKKTVLGPGRRCLLPASESFAAQSLQCEREIFVRVLARTTPQKEHLGKRCL
jgi:hypothetical protein